MLDVFKESAEAWLQHIKSPLIGSIVLSFIAINWKAIFFVVFSDVPILFRFWYFDSQTSLITLLALPAFFGVLIGLETPYINFGASRTAKFAIEKGRIPSARSASVVMAEKVELAAQREKDAASFKNAALENAQADQAIGDAELDDDIRAELQNKIKLPTKLSENEAARRKVIPIKEVFEELGNNSLASALLAVAAEAKDGEAYISGLNVNHDHPNAGRSTALKLENHRKKMEADIAIEQMVGFGLATKTTNGFSITFRGYSYLEQARNK